MGGMLGTGNIIIEFYDRVQTPLLKRRSKKQIPGGIFCRVKGHSQKLLKKGSRLVEKDAIRVPSDVK